ncbi:cysteine hydrolase family protein [Diaminobutyricibacter sp. McL0608]|uniref:cysteine hydrolase family protein n=1 Tax=Leifsonia sp. McL0608 TaxID=3143537 RepID=UPI0031F33426
MTRLLVIVDIQNDYFPGGAYPLVGPEAAAERAGALLAHFRASGAPIVHVQHVWDAPDATFMRPGTYGVEINDAVAPLADEPVVLKASPNSFLGTDLEHRIRDAAVGDVVIVGMMTSMCVDSTVRAAADLGFAVTVAADACAAPDLEFGDTLIPGDVVHAAFLAALGGSFATVTTVDDLTQHATADA